MTRILTDQEGEVIASLGHVLAMHVGEARDRLDELKAGIDDDPVEALLGAQDAFLAATRWREAQVAYVALGEAIDGELPLSAYVEAVRSRIIGAARRRVAEREEVAVGDPAPLEDYMERIDKQVALEWLDFSAPLRVAMQECVNVLRLADAGDSGNHFVVVPNCQRCAGEHCVDLLYFNDGDVVEAIDSGSAKARKCLGWQDTFAGISREVDAYTTYRKGHTPVIRSCPNAADMRKAAERNGLILLEEGK